MKKFYGFVLVIIMSITLLAPASQSYADMAKQFNEILEQAPVNDFWQIKAEEVSSWLRAYKKDFVIVDVRPNPAEYKTGHIPGAIQIPVQSIMKPESLKMLPKDKKIILYCVTGQTQNLPIVMLRALGYDAYTLAFGMSAWQKGYFGGQLMQGAINSANYLVVQ